MKDRPQSPTGFEHDRPYMKLDIWCEGEIEKKWGHDPATYPNQDLLQHYPNVQFNPSIAKDGIPLDAIDSNLNVITKLNVPSNQTSRPGFINKPVKLDDNQSVFKVSQEDSNEVGVEFAKESNVTLA